MTTDFAHRTVARYLPMLRAIFASFDASLVAEPKLEDKSELTFRYLEEEFGLSNLGHVTYLLKKWIKDSQDFEVQFMWIRKKRKTARWSDLLEMLDQKIIEHCNEVPVIEVGVYRSGRVARDFMGERFIHDFGAGDMKDQMIHLLAGNHDFTATRTIQKLIDAASEDSVYKTIHAINTALCKKLRLPKGERYEFIESKQGSGSRINPIYNVIFLD